MKGARAGREPVPPGRVTETFAAFFFTPNTPRTNARSSISPASPRPSLR